MNQRTHDRRFHARYKGRDPAYIRYFIARCPCCLQWAEADEGGNVRAHPKSRDPWVWCDDKSRGTVGRGFELRELSAEAYRAGAWRDEGGT